MIRVVSRTRALRAIVASPVAAFVAAASPKPAPKRPETEKLAQAEVGYVLVAPASKRPCKQCAHFLPSRGANVPPGCVYVAGPIVPGGNCRIWAPKPGR